MNALLSPAEFTFLRVLIGNHCRRLIVSDSSHIEHVHSTPNTTKLNTRRAGTSHEITLAIREITLAIV